MKSFLIALLLTQTVAIQANAKSHKSRTKAQIICDGFQAQVDDECAHLMCDDQIADKTFKNLRECVSADEYAEAAQEACDGNTSTVEDLAEKYNRKHPGTNIKCED